MVLLARNSAAHILEFTYIRVLKPKYAHIRALKPFRGKFALLVPLLYPVVSVTVISVSRPFDVCHAILGHSGRDYSRVSKDFFRLIDVVLR